MRTAKENPPVIDSSTQAFDSAIDAYVVAEAELQAATARRDAAKRAVMRARPTGVTSVEVTRRLKAAAVKADELVQVLVTKDRKEPSRIVMDHLHLPNVPDRETFVAEMERLARSNGVSSRS